MTQPSNLEEEAAYYRLFFDEFFDTLEPATRYLISTSKAGFAHNFLYQVYLRCNRDERLMRNFLSQCNAQVEADFWQSIDLGTYGKET